MTTARRWIARLLLAAAGLVAAAGLAELAFRMVAPNGAPLISQTWTPVEAISQRARQSYREAWGTFTYDDRGFRIGSGLPYERSVLFIGDSFTEGRGVGDADTFARAAERALRDDGLQVRALNAGQRGFGGAQELTVLRDVAAREPLDAIVLQVFPMNDLSDNLAYGGFGLDGDRLIAYDPPRPPWRARISNLVGRTWLHDLAIARAANNSMLTGDAAAPYDTPEAQSLERALLSEIVATARAHQLPIVILIVPTKLVQAVQRGLQADDGRGELQRFRATRDVVAALGVPWIDAGDVIPDLAADATTSDGGHFGPEGNRLVGEAIAARLAPLLRAQGDAAGHAS